MQKGKKIVIGNWKMNPQKSADAKRLFDAIKKHASKMKKVTTVVCPTFLHIHSLAQKVRARSIFLGAQDVFFEDKGAFTGEVSVSQLKDAKVSYIIIGHSERRARVESNVDVHIKIRKVLNLKMTPILCIGERERDTHGEYLTFLREQISSAVRGIKSKDVQQIIIAYEPVWAIGKTGLDAITAQKLHETILFIRRVLIELYSKDVACNMRILYGGSVKPENAKELLLRGEVAGFLVGSASIEATRFNQILSIVQNH